MRPLSTIARLLRFGGLAALSIACIWGQGSSLQNSGLQYLQTINIPTWKTPGTPGNANVDLFGYNPVTRTMYLADRTSHGVTVIDTHTNVVVGLIQMPPKAVPNVPLVAINLQQLVVSDGLQSVYVWDLRAPQAQPDVYTFPESMGSVTDGMAYDPINQTVYVVTDNPPEYLIGINLPFKKVVTQVPLPVSSDLIAWNPTDGKIYISAEDADGSDNNANAGVYSFDPATGAAPVQVVKVGPPCPGHGIDIDAVSNVAVVGCAAIPPPPSGQPGIIAVDLTAGKLLNTFSDITGTDTVVFNPNVRRFYTGSGLNTASTSGCPSPKPGPFGASVPILGMVDASGGSSKLTEGVACSGGGHVAGVDTRTNFVYVPVSQYPPDPNATTSGNAGVLVFRDNTPPVQAPVTQASATLAGSGNNSAAGTVQMTLISNHVRVTAGPTGLPSGTQAAWLVVPTTVANEWVACAVNDSNLSAVCNENLLGDPLIGATVTLSADGNAVARGKIALPSSH